MEPDLNLISIQLFGLGPVYSILDIFLCKYCFSLNKNGFCLHNSYKDAKLSMPQGW